MKTGENFIYTLKQEYLQILLIASFTNKTRQKYYNWICIKFSSHYWEAKVSYLGYGKYPHLVCLTMKL